MSIDAAGNKSNQYARFIERDTVAPEKPVVALRYNLGYSNGRVYYPIYIKLQGEIFSRSTRLGYICGTIFEPQLQNCTGVVEGTAMTLSAYNDSGWGTTLQVCDRVTDEAGNSSVYSCTSVRTPPRPPYPGECSTVPTAWIDALKNHFVNNRNANNEPSIENFDFSQFGYSSCLTYEGSSFTAKIQEEFSTQISTDAQTAYSCVAGKTNSGYSYDSAVSSCADQNNHTVTLINLFGTRALDNLKIGQYLDGCFTGSIEDGKSLQISGEQIYNNCKSQHNLNPSDELTANIVQSLNQAVSDYNTKTPCLDGNFITDPICELGQSFQNLILGYSVAMISAVQTGMQLNNPYISGPMTPFDNQALSAVYAWGLNYQNYANVIMNNSGVDITQLNDDLFRVGSFVGTFAITGPLSGYVGLSVSGAVTSTIGTGIVSSAAGFISGATASYVTFSLSNYVYQNALASVLSQPKMSLYEAFCGFEGGTSGCLKNASFGIATEIAGLAIPRIASSFSSVRLPSVSRLSLNLDVVVDRLALHTVGRRKQDSSPSQKDRQTIS